MYKYIGFCVLGVGILLIPILAVSLSLNGSKQNAFKLLIDHDGGADDAMAIFMALLHEQYRNGPEIVGLSTTHGNVIEDQVFHNTQRILNIAQRREVPIYRGSNSSLVTTPPGSPYYGVDGLGDTDYRASFEPIAPQVTHAVLAIIELSKKYEGQLILVMLGTATNLALAMRIDPLVIGRFAQIYVGAGHIKDANHPNPEFNAFMDVEGYRAVVQGSSPDRVTLVPFSQTNSSLNISRDWRLNVLGTIDTESVHALNAFENYTMMQDAMWDQLDPAVMAVVLDEAVVTEMKYSNNSIILCGEERGVNTNILEAKESSNVRILYSMDEDKFKQLLVDIFSSELK
ncbi:unnamed protein product [Plutella xylostella]|uniref:(diamondback moth) hypothetical protein n=1 Tax=Plutella xylostella TaxID=51655 RepID=A0A8S4E6V8_PLUXY|nr:unnamed protein product [Plutella xylostella]